MGKKQEAFPSGMCTNQPFLIIVCNAKKWLLHQPDILCLWKQLHSLLGPRSVTKIYKTLTPWWDVSYRQQWRHPSWCWRWNSHSSQAVVNVTKPFFILIDAPSKYVIVLVFGTYFQTRYNFQERLEHSELNLAPYYFPLYGRTYKYLDSHKLLKAANT